MTFNGFFVDDHDEIYAKLLSRAGDEPIAIQYLRLDEAATLAGTIFDAHPDIVALDFQLDDNPAMIDPKKSYNGSGLAQLLRDKASAKPQYDFPIILVSGEDKLERFYRPDGTSHDLFDRIYEKAEVSDSADPVQRQIVSLCRGYELLKSAWATPATRLAIFGLKGDEFEPIANQELRTAITSAGAPHIAARTILRGLIDRAGILLSDNEVAARLGLASIDSVASVLIEQGIKYDGIFSEGWRRWWTHRFDIWATDLFGARPITQTGTLRAQKLHETLGLDVQPALSTWNNSSDEKFAFSCSVCSRAGEIRHSVAAFDPHAPKFSQRKRICWDCIQTGLNVEKKVDVEDVDAKLASEVRKKPRNDDAVG